MSSDESKPAWKEDLITWAQPIGILVATVISVLTLIPLIWRPVALIPGIWCACLYIRCRREKPVIVGSKKGSYVFSENARTMALVALIVLPSFLLGALLSRFVDIIPATSTPLANQITGPEAQDATDSAYTLTPPSATLIPSLTPVSTSPLAASPATLTATSISLPEPTSASAATPADTPVAVLSTATPTAIHTSRVGQEWVNLRSFPSPAAGPSGIVRVADSLWAIVSRDRRLYRLNLEGDILAETNFSAPCDNVAWDGESLWCTSAGRVQQIDPTSGQELTEFETDMGGIQGISWDGSTLWIIDWHGNLARYDRAGQQLRRLAVAVYGWPIELTWVAAELWVVDVHGTLTRFDSEFEEIGSFSLSQCGAGPFPYDLALYWDGEALWLADSNQNRILQCAPAD